ncbi:MAG: periplasmic-type flagellar collar protein FlbB [Brevinemataceae bacterium]
MNAWIRVFLLLLVNIFIAGLGLYVFDFMQIIDYRTVLDNMQIQPLKQPVKIEDKNLLEREELNKKWELLAIKEADVSNQNNSIESNLVAIKTDQNALLEAKESFANEQALEVLKKEEQNSYNIKITEVARQISGMPPQDAAALLNLQDDQQVADILKKLEETAVLNNQGSIVPYLLTLMEREKAARIQSLMLSTDPYETSSL